MIKYPNDFRSSTINTKVENKEIEENINHSLELLKRNDEKQHLSFFGDTMILINKVHEEDGGGYEIIVTNNYQQRYVDNKVFNNN